MDRGDLNRIYHEIIHTINKHMNTHNGVVCDIGSKSDYYKYVYSDMGLGLCRQKSIDDAKIIFMNDSMKIFIKLQSLMGEFGPRETIDEHIYCSEFICKPGCSCGKWDKEEDIDYKKFDRMCLDSEDIQ